MTARRVFEIVRGVFAVISGVSAIYGVYFLIRSSWLSVLILGLIILAVAVAIRAWPKSN